MDIVISVTRGHPPRDNPVWPGPATQAGACHSGRPDGQVVVVVTQSGVCLGLSVCGKC